MNSDVEQRRLAEAAIAESEARFRNLADHAPVMMWVTDPAGRCLYLNRLWYEFTGQSPEEAEGFGWLDAIHPDDRPEAGRVFFDANSRAQPFRLDYRLRRADGVYRWSIDAASPRFGADGGFLGYVGSVIDIEERREAEARLALSEERLRLATEAADIGLWDVDVVHDRLFWPPVIKGMFGIGPDVAVSMADFYDGLHPDDRAKTAEAFAAACDPGTRALYDVEYRTIGKEDGIVRWVAAKGRGLFNADGRCVRVIGAAVDISARKETQAALRDSEGRYHALFGAIDAGFCVVEVDLGDQSGRLDYRVIEANPAFFAHTGFEEAILGRWLREAMPTLEEHWFDIYGRVARTGVPERFEEGSDTLKRWFDVYAFRSGGADDRRVAILFNDISARREAEARLRDLNEQLEVKVAERTAERDEIWRNSGDLMLVARHDATILAVNPAWRDMLGWTEAELVGRSFLDLVHPDDLDASVAEARRITTPGETTLHFQNRYGRKDGGWVWLSWAVSSTGGRFYGVARDVTIQNEQAAALAQAQEALRQSQKMEAMGSLTGGVAHDFNNLLTPIIGSLDHLERKGLGGERERRLIAGALQSADRAKTLVQRLLAFARRQPLQATAINVGRLVENMSDLITSTTGPQIKVAIEVEADLPAARADPNQIEMALLNLAVNARDAMPEGGVLRISATREAVPATDDRGLQPGDYVRLSVADTGVGMDEATLRRAVEPFFSTKGVGRGTGLGLSMAHGLASQLGGALTIQSLRGIGTNVELWLPVSAERAEDDASAAEAAEHPSGAGAVLLVDDEDLVRMTTADMLTELGYTVVEAESAERALELVEGGLEPRVLVTDHLMPGMSGAELARELRASRPHLQVLIVSGYAEADGVAPDLPRLTKPFRSEDLAASLSILKA
jgi:PAS domain S-box-containing protein